MVTISKHLIDVLSRFWTFAVSIPDENDASNKKVRPNEIVNQLTMTGQMLHVKGLAGLAEKLCASKVNHYQHSLAN